MRAVNLMPRDDRRQVANKDAALPLITGVSAAVFVAALLSAFLLMESGKIDRAKAELSAVQAELDSLPVPPPPPSQAEQQLSTQEAARVTALATALSRRVAWDRILRQVSLTLPEDVSLQVLKAKSPVTGSNQNPAAPPSPAVLATGLSLEGTTFSHASVARLLSRLQVIPDLTNVQLVESTRPSQGPSIVKFKIAADVRLPGAAA